MAVAQIDVQPRGLPRHKAAAYVGMSASTFDRWVADGRMPVASIREGRCIVWDRFELDDAFEALKADPIANDEWDDIQ